MSADPKSTSARGLPSAVEWAHLLIGERLGPGDVAVDATAGNGHDTLFLARKVAPEGTVFAYDVQAAALDRTRERVIGEGFSEEQVVTLCVSHETFADTLPARFKGRVQAIMFNLGYLPGSDKSLITQPGPTLRAIQVGLDWLALGGIMTVVIYPGHAGGEEEAEAVRALGSRLSPKEVVVQQIRPVNRFAHPPECWVFSKRG